MKSQSKYDSLLQYLEKQCSTPITITNDSEENKVVSTSFQVETKNEIIEKNKELCNYTHVTPRKKCKGFDIQAFEDALKQKNELEFQASQSYERPYISITELFNCIRKNYFIRMKYQIQSKNTSSYPYLYLINKVGNIIHKVIQDVYSFEKNEHVVICEKYKVKGRIDAINKNNVIEIKTIDPKDFNGEYNPIHFYQGNVGAFILNNDYGFSINNITLIYVLRTCKVIDTFDIDYDENLAKKYLQNGLVLKNCIETNQIPETINKTDEECKYCSYTNYCIKKKENKTKPVFLL